MKTTGENIRRIALLHPTNTTNELVNDDPYVKCPNKNIIDAQLDTKIAFAIKLPAQLLENLRLHAKTSPLPTFKLKKEGNFVVHTHLYTVYIVH